MVGYIYKITNKVNGKIYIGQTIKTIRARWNQHKRNAKYSLDHKEYDHYFARAILKYGPDNFIVETLEIIELETEELLKDELNRLEIHYIAQYDSMKKGYNSNPGGKAPTGRRNELSPRSKPIIQYDYDGNVLNEFPCLAEAARSLNIIEDPIRKCANGYHPYCKNLQCIWRWKNNTDLPIIAYDIPRILQFTLDRTLVKRWYSYKTIVLEMGERYAKNVSRACLGNRDTFNGYIWQYENRS